MLEKNTDGAWEASEWEATGQGNFGSGSMEFDGSITVGYTKDNEDTAENEGEEQSNNEEGRYYINEATLSAEAEDIFAGNITAKNINITKDNGKWGAESWSATANLTLPGLPIKNSAEAAIEYQRNKDQEIYTVSNAEVDIDIAGVSLGGAAAMQMVKHSRQNKRRIVVRLSAMVQLMLTLRV